MKNLNALPPLTPREETRTVKIAAEANLFTVWDAARRKQKRTMKELIEWGMKVYLLQVSPDEAKKLGIRGDGNAK